MLLVRRVEADIEKTGRGDRESERSEILLVEDNHADAQLVLHAFRAREFFGNLRWVVDGAEALDYIFKRGKYPDVRRPDLILLDLNLPKIEGREVLRTLKTNVDTCGIPIIVLTTSRRDGDVLNSHEYGVKSFITKPNNLKGFQELIQRLVLVDFPQLGIVR